MNQKGQNAAGRSRNPQPRFWRPISAVIASGSGAFLCDFKGKIGGLPSIVYRAVLTPYSEFGSNLGPEAVRMICPSTTAFSALAHSNSAPTFTTAAI